MKLMIALLTALLLSGCASNLQLEHYKAHKQHQYVSDEQQYGKVDAWKPSLKGDCEDYALYMRERVGGALLDVTTVTGEKHMVLIVNGVFDDKKKPVSGLIVDNQSKTVYPVSQMTHKFVYQLTDTHIKQFMKARGVNAASGI